MVNKAEYNIVTRLDAEPHNMHGRSVRHCFSTEQKMHLLLVSTDCQWL